MSQLLIEIFIGKTLVGYAANYADGNEDPYKAVRPVIVRLNWYLWSQQKKEFSFRRKGKKPATPYFTAEYAEKTPWLEYDARVSGVIALNLHFGREAQPQLKRQALEKGDVGYLLDQASGIYKDFNKNRTNLPRREQLRGSHRGIVYPLLTPLTPWDPDSLEGIYR